MDNIKDFIAAYEKADIWWEALDRPILRACKERPDHKDAREVFGKIALVNRAYRANVHMGTKNAEWKLAEQFVSDGVDRYLAPLDDIRAFSKTSLASVITAHEQLVCVARIVTGRTENSFIAKYLGFHFPALVPLFDVNAYNCSWRLLKRELPRGLYPENWNVDYGYHCEAVLRLMGALGAHGVTQPVLKLVDYVLYSER